jgi:hypothetical protein
MVAWLLRLSFGAQGVSSESQTLNFNPRDSATFAYFVFGFSYSTLIEFHP